MSAFEKGGPPVPDDGLSVEIVTSGTVVRPVTELPPIRDADLVTRVSGKNVVISLGRGVVDLASGRRLTIANGVFEIPNSQMKKPPARVRMRIEGPVPAAAELLASDRLREASGSPLDPAGSKGTVTAQVALNLPIDPDMPKGAVKYNIVADIANFAVDKFTMDQRIEAQSLRVTADPDGYEARGDVRIGGMPAMVDYRKPRGDGEGELRLQATFDDAARTPLRLRFQRRAERPDPDPARRQDRAVGRAGQPLRDRGRPHPGQDRQPAAGLDQAGRQAGARHLHDDVAQGHQHPHRRHRASSTAASRSRARSRSTAAARWWRRTSRCSGCRATTRRASRPSG